MKTIYHAAGSRGLADHGWLKSYHTFSFANYHHPERVHFGCLRVLNDDFVQGGMGFGKHPHQDMEIISIPLEGELKHGDDMGNNGIITKGEIQVMSAGTGIYHSEQNAKHNASVKFLQIWIFPNQSGLTPRYDQQRYDHRVKTNDWTLLLSPDTSKEGVWIHQDAWFHLGNFMKDQSKRYTLQKSGNGVYIFLLKGKIKINEQELNTRDGLGISETDYFTIEIVEDHTEMLLIEIPMKLPEYLH